MSKLLVKIIKLNEYLFPFIICASYIALGLETYSYIGYLKKFIFVDSRFFLVLALISALLVTQVKPRKSIIIKINNILLPLLLITYLAMQALEAFYYHNYIFSNFHIQQDNFLYLVILSAGIFMIGKFCKKITKPNDLSILIILIVSAFVLVDNLKISMNEAVYSDLFIATHINMTYDEKMQSYWGIYYEYITFVKNNTLENSTIIVPPQESPWLMTGNIALDRYFLYPREFIQGTFNEPLDLKSADYVMLAWGEWKENDTSKYGWPKVKVDVKEIIYMNKDKNWGILKVNK
jgi:hypothetical protein